MSHKKKDKMSETPTEAMKSDSRDAELREAEDLTALSAEAPLLPGQLEELRGKAAKADEHWDRLVRLTADFDNFKKRAVRERQDAIKFANTALIEKLVPVLDNFDMAVSAANAPGGTPESLKTGISMIYNQIRTALADAGLEEIDASNQPFNPAWHEAVSEQESAEAPEGHVIQQLRKGYKLRDRLVRPASVVVAKKPPA